MDDLSSKKINKNDDCTSCSVQTEMSIDARGEANIEPMHSERIFWNERSSSFPRYNASIDSFEVNILSKIKSMGVDFAGSSVLDIGCGNGMYTLHIAQEAKEVIALDIAEKMLDNLQSDAFKIEVNNITAIRADWLTFEVTDHMKGDLDIVFSAMTPALKDNEGRERVLNITAKHRVYIAYAGAQRSNIFQPLFERHGIAREHINEAFNMIKWLDSKELPYETTVVEGEWHTDWSVSDLKERYSSSLARRGVKEDWNFFEEHIAKHCAESKYHEITNYILMIIVW